MAEKMSKNQKKRRERLFKLLKLLIYILFSIVICSSLKYHFVDGFKSPVWYVALVLGVTGGVLFSIKFVSKDARVGEKIMLYIIIVFLAICLIGSIFAHINHFFDNGEVERYVVEIEDKHSTTSRKNPDTYEFEVTLNGETFDIHVTRSDYRALDVGDSYIIEYHEGALGVPYYIAVGPVP